MNIFTIPLKNLRRKLLRTVVLVTVFTVGILSVVTLFSISATVGHSLEKQMTAFGANILIYPKTDSLNISYGGFSMGNLSYEVKYLKERETIEAIKTIENNGNISTIAPKLITITKYNGSPLAVTGVDWSEESKIKSYWNIEGKMPEAEYGAIIGERASRVTGLKRGDKLPVGSGELTITGILRKTGTEDDNLVFAGLASVQALTGNSDIINFVEVAALCSGCPIDDIVKQMQAKLPGTDISAMQNIVKQRMSTISYVKRMVLLVSGVILVIACFMLSMFMLASVNERKKEIGILRAVGYSGTKIFMIFGFEALIVGVSAGVLGYTGGYFSSVEIISRLDMSTAGHISFQMNMLVLAALSAGLLSIVSASVPAMKAVRVQPTEVFSQI